MLTQQDIKKIENGDEEPAYREYCNDASSLTITMLSFYLPMFLFYLFFFKFLKWILFSKIVLGVLLIVPLFLALLFPVALFEFCFIKYKNKWLKLSSLLHVILYGTHLTAVVLYFTKVL